MTDEGTLAAPGDASDDGEAPERQPEVHVAEVVGARPAELEPGLGPPRAASGGKRTGQRPGGGRALQGEDVGRRPFGDNAPAPAPAGGPQVHEVVRGTQRVRVVLHHQHRRARVHQRPQVLKQPARVPRVKPNGGLVEDVQGARQPAPAWAASRSRCISPPLKVEAFLSRDR